MEQIIFLQEDGEVGDRKSRLLQLSIPVLLRTYTVQQTRLTVRNTDCTGKAG